MFFGCWCGVGSYRDEGFGVKLIRFPDLWALSSLDIAHLESTVSMMQLGWTPHDVYGWIIGQKYLSVIAPRIVISAIVEDGSLIS